MRKHKVPGVSAHLATSCGHGYLCANAQREIYAVNSLLQFSFVSCCTRADVECKFCKQKQTCNAYVHPVTKEPLRGYDTERLKVQMAEIISRSRPKRPANQITRERAPALTQSRVPSTKGLAYPWQNEPATAAGTKATALVPRDVAPGDQLTLVCADGRRVRVIVETLE